MKEFVINNFLTLRLEDGKTNIYINDKLVNQCKYLMLNIPIEDLEKFDEIESIDEAADVLGWTEDGQEGVKYELDPETEFWGHCSNLQAWYEHKYDTRLLHSTLSFPLLIELIEAGDLIAKKAYKEEIAKRFESGNPNIIRFILEEGLLDYLNKEEKISLIKQRFSGILNIGDFPDKSIDDYFNKTVDYIFNSLLKLAQEKGWKDEYFPAFLQVIYELLYYKSEAFSQLLEIARKKGWRKELFYMFLESIDKFTDTYDKYFSFTDLIDSLKNTDIVNNPKIESKFIILAEGINKLQIVDDYDEEKKYSACSQLLRVAKITGLIKEHISTLLDAFSNINYESYGLYDDLLSAIPNVSQRFAIFKIILEKTKNPGLQSYLFNNFLKTIEDSKVVKQNIEFIMFFFEEALKDNLSEGEYEFYQAYIFIIKFIEKLIAIGLLNIKITENSTYYANDYYERLDHCTKGFYTLIEEIRDTEIIEYLIPNLLFTIWAYSDNELGFETYKLFSLLLEIAYKKNLLEKHLIYFVIYYNWRHYNLNSVGIKNLLENFLEYFSRDQIVSILTPALQNTELLLEYKHYKRILGFFEMFTKGGGNPFLKAFLVHILLKNSSEINLYLVEQYFLHRLEAEDFKEVLKELGPKFFFCFLNPTWYGLEYASTKIAELLKHIYKEIPKILKNQMKKALKDGSYEFIFSFFKYSIYEFFYNEIFDKEFLFSLLEDHDSTFKMCLIELLEQNEIQSEVWRDYLKRKEKNRQESMTKSRLKENRMIVTLIFINIYQELGPEYFLDLFTLLPEPAKKQLIKCTKRLIKYSSQLHDNRNLNRQLHKLSLITKIKHSARDLLVIIDKEAWQNLKYVTIKGEQFYIINNKLDLSRQKLRDINDISGLAEHTDLKELILSINMITKIEGLDSLINLEILNLGVNKISKIEGLKHCTKLKSLSLGNNNIREIEGLETLKNLETLYISKNSIYEIKGLDTLENLKKFYISANHINKIKGLENLKKLEILGFSENHISEIKGIFHLVKLKEFYLSENNIKDVSDLDQFESLEQLTMKKNPILESHIVKYLSHYTHDEFITAKLLKKYCQAKKSKEEPSFSLEKFVESLFPEGDYLNKDHQRKIFKNL